MTGEDANNYIIVQPEYGEIMAEITKPDSPLMNISSNIVSINNTPLEEILKTDEVINKDEILVKLSIKNIGEGGGYVSKIQTKLPEGVELLEGSKINEKFKWKKTKTGEIIIEDYSIENNPESEISVSKESKTNDETKEKEELDEIIVRFRNQSK